VPVCGRDPLRAGWRTLVEGVGDELFYVRRGAPLQRLLLQRDALVGIFVQDLALAVLVHKCDQHRLFYTATKDRGDTFGGRIGWWSLSRS
jgi:hypothetical protein